MSELRALVAAVRELRAAHEPFVSATVVAVRGSGYRKPGARMVASEQRWRAGSISGGCLERDVVNKGLWYTREQRACLVTYDQSEDEQEQGGGTGCQGVVDVLIERHLPERDDAWFQAAERCLHDEASAVVLTVVRSDQAELPLGARAVLQAGAWQGEPALRERFEREASYALTEHAQPFVAGDGLAVLVECVLPPVHLFVFGTGHDAVPLVAHAKTLGWTVSVWDASPRSSARERFQLADHYLTGSVHEAIERAARSERAAAVVMGHHFARDREALAGLLASSVPYLGILGSRVRSAQLLEACGVGDVDASTRARLHTPIGLSLGAETPAEIALSIVAEVQKTFGRSPGPRARSAVELAEVLELTRAR